MEERKKKSPRVQMTPDALFGPYFVVSAPFLIYISYVRPKKETKCYLVTKKDERKRKENLWPKRWLSHLLGPFSLFFIPQI